MRAALNRTTSGLPRSFSIFENVDFRALVSPTSVGYVSILMAVLFDALRMLVTSDSSRSALRDINAMEKSLEAKTVAVFTAMPGPDPTITRSFDDILNLPFFYVYLYS